MTLLMDANVIASEPNAHGYAEFTLGEFRFRRDEYFVYVKWPTGGHVMSVDGFLRAIQRRLSKGRDGPRRELPARQHQGDLRAHARRLDQRDLRPVRVPGGDRVRVWRQEWRQHRRRGAAAGR